MARKEVQTTEVWYSDDGCRCCDELDALVEDFNDAINEASGSLTPRLVQAIRALNAFVDRVDAPKPKKKAPQKA